jgi:hypothetical protein
MHALRKILQALARSRRFVFSIMSVYAAAVLTGGIMVHAGSDFAVGVRDRLVARAFAQDPAAVSLTQGHRLRAAGWDFAQNLVRGALPDTVSGLAVVFPYAFAAYRGWIGGIVSIDDKHHSRLGERREAVYYLTTLLFQLVPYALAGGAGVRAGLALLHRDRIPGPRWCGIPREAVLDVAWLYALIVPLFFAASLWEFLLR